MVYKGYMVPVMKTQKNTTATAFAPDLIAEDDVVPCGRVGLAAGTLCANCAYSELDERRVIVNGIVPKGVGAAQCAGYSWSLR